jgi:hypothetical protein
VRWKKSKCRAVRGGENLEVDAGLAKSSHGGDDVVGDDGLVA